MPVRVRHQGEDLNRCGIDHDSAGDAAWAGVHELDTGGWHDSTLSDMGNRAAAGSDWSVDTRRRPARSTATDGVAAGYDRSMASDPTNARTYPDGVPCWIDARQPDPDAAAAFYGGLFGWTFTAPRRPASALAT